MEPKVTFWWANSMKTKLLELAVELVPFTCLWDFSNRVNIFLPLNSLTFWKKNIYMYKKIQLPEWVINLELWSFNLNEWNVMLSGELVNVPLAAFWVVESFLVQFHNYLTLKLKWNLLRATSTYISAALNNNKLWEIFRKIPHLDWH